MPAVHPSETPVTARHVEEPISNPPATPIEALATSVVQAPETSQPIESVPSKTPENASHSDTTMPFVLEPATTSTGEPVAIGMTEVALTAEQPSEPGLFDQANATSSMDEEPADAAASAIADLGGQTEPARSESEHNA